MYVYMYGSMYIRHGANLIPYLELMVNSNSSSRIGIDYLKKWN